MAIISSLHGRCDEMLKLLLTEPGGSVPLHARLARAITAYALLPATPGLSNSGSATQRVRDNALHLLIRRDRDPPCLHFGQVPRFPPAQHLLRI